MNHWKSFFPASARGNSSRGEARGAACGSRVFGLTLGAGLLALFAVTAAAVPGRRSAPAHPRPDAVMVAFRRSAATQSRLQAVNRAGLSVAGNASSPYVTQLKLTPAAIAAGQTVETALASLRADPSVRIAEPDYPVRALGLPNDPLFSSLYGLHNTGQNGGVADADIDAPEAWDITTGSKSVIVGVIDTGVDYRHPDLDYNILRDAKGAVVGYDFLNEDADPMDDNGHGTHVSGTIGARGNNGVGVVGVNHVVRIMPLKFLGADGSGYESGAIRAIDFAVAHGARILSNSWGGGEGSHLLLEAIQRAEAAGVLFVAAAGNDSSDNDQLPAFPASFNRDASNVVAVAATDNRDELAWFSNYGTHTVDLAAPGVDVLSTTPNNSYSYYSGTSMATPHVSGVAALILARYPGLSLEALKLRLTTSADSLTGLVGATRFGRLNALQALEPDEVPPGPPIGFRAVSRGQSGLLLTWDASGDDGYQGSSSQIDLRYSTQPITDANFADALPAGNLPEPGAPGSPHTYLLGDLEPEMDYFVALRAVDNVGNTSSLAIIGPLRTLASAGLELLKDDAEGVARFAGEGTWGLTAETHSGGFTSYGDSPGQPYANGTNFSLTQVTSAPLARGETVLRFQAKTDLEYGADILYVETSPDDGASWFPLTTLTGISDWSPHQFVLAAQGDRVKVRFRLNADESVARDGVWLDDISIFAPAPLCLFQDTGEGTQGFTGEGGWSLTHEDSFSPTHSYSDSPGINYSNNSDISLVQTTGLSLGSTLSQLTFQARLSLEPFYDNLLVEASQDDGETWQLLDHLTGEADWQTYRVSLARFYGQTIRVRFRLDTDVSNTLDGVWLDDIRICGDPLTAFDADPPAAPSALVATAASATRVNVTWASDAAGVTSFRIERHSSGQTFLPVGTALGAERSYSDTALAPGTEYTYRILANRDGLPSPYSNESTTVTLPSPPVPSPASNLQVGAVTRTTVVLSWNDNSANEEGFRIERSIGSADFRAIENLLSNTISFVDSALTPGTSYTYRVVATSAGGDATPSNAVVANTKSPEPTGQIQVSTNDVSFGAVRVGRKVTRRLVVTNAGAGALTGTIPAVAAPFKILSGGGRFRLAPGRKRVVVIQFSPKQADFSVGELVIQSSDPSQSALSVLLEGFGQ